MSETQEETLEMPQTCALEGCENPLSPPAVDAEGRRKGGRPSAYCGKAHADAASRARRTATIATVSDPLADVRRLAEGFEPAAAGLVELLQGIRASFAEAESAALARVTEAEAQAAQARKEADDAQQESVKAATARNQALAAARDDRLARAKAEKTAERAEEDAEEHKQRAWSEIAAHERARGAAEAAARSAEAARDELAGEVRNLREQFLALRADSIDLTKQLAERDAALARLTAEHEATLERLDHARRLTADTERDRDTARRESSQSQLELQKERERSAEENTARRLAEARAAGLAGDLTLAREQVISGQARLDQLVAQLAELARPEPAAEELSAPEGVGAEYTGKGPRPA
ncbi:MAG: hypothetical protein QOI21_681 [Actinomycetota bacterium]|nr:hypothetical protein [Actinomycetota bacterium]